MLFYFLLLKFIFFIFSIYLFEKISSVETSWSKLYLVCIKNRQENFFFFLTSKTWSRYWWMNFHFSFLCRCLRSTKMKKKPSVSDQVKNVWKKKKKEKKGFFSYVYIYIRVLSPLYSQLCIVKQIIVWVWRYKNASTKKKKKKEKKNATVEEVRQIVWRFFIGIERTTI